MDCFRLRSLSFGGQVVAVAPLRKRFAFVAGNDEHGVHGLFHFLSADAIPIERWMVTTTPPNRLTTQRH